MNSLVVLFSLVALAAAKPSGLLHSEVLAYAAPAIATYPAAVSHQSRIDIKSSPAYVATAAVAPIARTVIAEPAIVAAPAIAPAAVSHQSRIDIKSSPAVISSFVAAPAAVAAPAVAYAAPAPALVKTAVATPVAYAAPAVAAVHAPVAYAAPVAVAAPVAYAAPAAAAAPSVPLDTPEVQAARAAHFEAKAIAEANALHDAHFIHKRSAPFIAAPAVTYAATPFVSSYAAAPVVHHVAPLAYTAPLALHTPLIPKAYSVHPW